MDPELFKDVKVEDIEDVTESFHGYLGVTFDPDTVKKVRLAGGKELYLLSLMEHKSTVDYDVTMQLLRYMVCIWNEEADRQEKEEKSMEDGGTEEPGKKKGKRKKPERTKKTFRYPFILPIVHYEGSGKWTAATHLKDRINMDGVNGILDNAEAYIPDFSYKLIQTKDYSNEQLLEKNNEMSVFMMMNKVQTKEGLSALIEANYDKMEKILKKMSPETMKLLVDVVWNLCIKMNATTQEAEECVANLREVKMGYWHENIEKMDIQAERRNTAEQRERAEKAEERAEKAEENLNRGVKRIVDLEKASGMSFNEVVEDVQITFGLSAQSAKEKVGLYWDK